jgi:hypothetical protein
MLLATNIKSTIEIWQFLLILSMYGNSSPPNHSTFDYFYFLICVLAKNNSIKKMM